jgi:hypothetical protein
MTTRSMPLEMLNRQMKNWGLYESYRKQAEQLRVKKEGSRGDSRRLKP